MVGPKNKYEEIGLKGPKARLANNAHLTGRSFENTFDIPILRVNENNEVELASIPVIPGHGRVLTEDNRGGILKREKVLINSEHLSDKGFNLAHVPMDTDAVMIAPVGGIIFDNGEDFEVSGNWVSWENKALDNRLVEGDTLQIFYQY